MVNANDLIRTALADWLEWVESGAEQKVFQVVDGEYKNVGGKFGREHGLCIIVVQYLAQLESDVVITPRMSDAVSEIFEKKIDEISDKLREDGVTVSGASPFCRERMGYLKESQSRLCHTNEHRIAFARAVVAGEITFEEPTE